MVATGSTGDIYRAYMARANYSTSLTRTLGTIFSERVFDVGALIIMVMGSAAFIARSPETSEEVGRILAVAALALAVLALGVLFLLIFGVYGILFELYSPGWGVAGTLGVVSLVLGFFGLSVLPFNYAGLALIAIALSLFVAEAFVTSFGALTVGGIVGAMMPVLAGVGSFPLASKNVLRARFRSA